MKSSDFMDKRIPELSRSHSDDFSDLSYSRGREPEEDDDLSYGLSKDDLSCSSFHFRPVRPVVSPNSYDSTFQNRSSTDYIDPLKAGSRKVGAFSDGELISVIDRKMEEHSKNLLHVIEGLSVRMCQLESRTRKIEDTVDELKDSSVFNHGRTEGKLRQLENILTEIQCGIRDLRDKREISEVQLELTKLQILKSQEKSQDKKPKTNTSSSGQGVASSVQQQSNQSQPIPVMSPQQFPPNPNISQIPSYQSPQTPIAGQFPAQVSKNQIPSIPRAESNYLRPMLSSESTHQQYSMPPVQQPPPTSSAPCQPYQPVPQLPPTSQLQHLPPPHPSHDVVGPQGRYLSVHDFGEASYMSPQNYNTRIQRTFNAPGLAFPNQQTYVGSNQRVYDQPSRGSEFLPEHMQPTRYSSFHDDYSRSGLPSQYNSSKMKSSELPSFSQVLASENRFSQLPTAQVLPRALPMASDVDSGSGSSGNRNSIPIDDVINNIVAMGFRRDIVRATVKKMTESGQSVDLNVVLDKLMNGGEVQQESLRFGR